METQALRRPKNNLHQEQFDDTVGAAKLRLKLQDRTSQRRLLLAAAVARSFCLGSFSGRDRRFYLGQYRGESREGDPREREAQGGTHEKDADEDEPSPGLF
jgi:hypothetical protein